MSSRHWPGPTHHGNIQRLGTCKVPMEWTASVVNPSFCGVAFQFLLLEVIRAYQYVFTSLAHVMTDKIGES